MPKLAVFIVLVFFLLSCQPPPKFDLIVRNAKVLEVTTGTLRPGQTIGIRADTIAAILPASTRVTFKWVIDAQGKLITPGFVDTHIHPVSAFSEGSEQYSETPDAWLMDSVADYRQKLTAAYLPYGTTTVLAMGHPDSWITTMLDWTIAPQPEQVDLYTCGGALVTTDGYAYLGHSRVDSPQAAREKITEYHEHGIRHLKFYSQLREPEFAAAYQRGKELRMKIFGHIGGFWDTTNISIQQTLAYGLTDYEHISILSCSVFNEEDWWEIQKQYNENYQEVIGDKSLLYVLEAFAYLDTHRQPEFLQLLDQLAEQEATVSTTIGWLYKTYHDTFFDSADLALTAAQSERCHRNFTIFMKYVKLIHERGIAIRVGTDTHPGGQVLLLELMLLSEYGISIADAFKIATINGAKALEIDDEVGTIEIGKKATLLIWDKSPFENYHHFTAKKTVVKDGVLVIDNR